MRQTSFTRLLTTVQRLTPEQIIALDDALSKARLQVEALIEIDGKPEGQWHCPHCGGVEHQRWGRTRTGMQRRRCGVCERTSSGLTNTPIQGVHRPDLLLRLVQDMLTGGPRACRAVAARLGVSRHTAWRWRMKVLECMGGPIPEAYAGIVEADEAYQRESRKGSREWVRHKADTSLPKPPRPRWYDFGREGPPKGFVQKWQLPMLTVADRAGHTSFERLQDTKQPTIQAALLPRIRPDAVLCTDGAIQYENIARAARIEHFVFVAGRRSRRAPKSHHINTVNGAHRLFREWMELFRGPASKHLDGYLRWFVLCRNKNNDHRAIFQRLISTYPSEVSPSQHALLT